MLLLLSALEEQFSKAKSVDDGLIERIKHGDMDAFRNLYEIASSGVYGFALSILNNTHDAEDVLQDTFLTVHKSVSTYTSMGKPMAWIFTITRNHAMMRLREKKRDNEFEEIQNLADEENSSLCRIEDAENRMLIELLMTTLESEERQIVMLHASAGLKNREIASLLELPLNTVLSKYHRAIKKLRTAAEKEGLFK